jgi:hypothetical protein
MRKPFRGESRGQRCFVTWRHPSEGTAMEIVRRNEVVEFPNRGVAYKRGDAVPWIGPGRVFRVLSAGVAWPGDYLQAVLREVDESGIYKQRMPHTYFVNIEIKCVRRGTASDDPGQGRGDQGLPRPAPRQKPATRVTYRFEP